MSQAQQTTHAKQTTLKEVKQRIRGLDEDRQKSMVCALVGHSRIQTHFFGYYYCARCGTQVGDALASVYPGASKSVVVNHDCKICRANFAKCDWRDKFMAPDPFAMATEGATTQ